MPVTLINVFSVPKAKEEEFVKWWQDVKSTLTERRIVTEGTPGTVKGLRTMPN